MFQKVKKQGVVSFDRTHVPTRSSRLLKLQIKVVKGENISLAEALETLIHFFAKIYRSIKMEQAGFEDLNLDSTMNNNANNDQNSQEGPPILSAPVWFGNPKENVLEDYTQHRQVLEAQAAMAGARAPLVSAPTRKMKIKNVRRSSTTSGSLSSIRSTNSSNMSADSQSPLREGTPTTSTSAISLPQQRVLEADHQPAVSSPLNPNPDFKTPKPQDDAPTIARERASRAKKESLKKRESKAGSIAPDNSARATPDPKASSSSKSKKKEAAPGLTRYKLPPPRITDYDVPRGPIFIPAHTKTAPDGTEVQFNETTDQ